MKIVEIRATLEALMSPEAGCPDPFGWAQLKADWEDMRHSVPASYWPILDDRIALVEGRIALAKLADR